MGNQTVRKTLRWIIIAGFLIAPAVVAVFAIRSARQAARQMQRANNIKQVGLALLSFNDARDRLPRAVHADKAGQPLSSWRFRILAYLEAIMMDVDFEAKWDDTTNQYNIGFINSPFTVYCWSSRAESSKQLNTNVMAITGPGTAFEEDQTIRLSEMDQDTILAIEVADSGTHWMEPGDIDVRNVPESITQGMDGAGVHVVFADGAVWFLRSDTPLEELKKFFTIDGAKQFDREKVLGPYVLRQR